MSPEEAAALNELERKMAQHAVDRAAVEAVVGPIFNNRAVLREVKIVPQDPPERALFQVQRQQMVCIGCMHKPVYMYKSMY